ncbi:hypothetical protein TIFTF001_032696 [Ficus carica]|uniref:Uncharacterized protein n=1 Tax=Ficus carica TaxID=3494 RepID=A0AA88DX61_FICCA|nr:hypothetical protein TIFTF001_032696 [Ficus carica]
MASMPLGPHHQPPQPQPENSNETLKIVSRRVSGMETDKIVSDSAENLDFVLNSVAIWRFPAL